MAKEVISSSTSLVQSDLLTHSLNNLPAVSSLDLARHFEIGHRHVLRDIRALVDKCPQSFTEPNFGLSEYQDETGRSLPMYLLTRDGFTLLAMGYNSRRAIEWKLKYIAAFNALEAFALEQAKQQALAAGFGVAQALGPEVVRRLGLVRRYLGLGLTQRQAALLVGVSRSTVQTLLSQAKALGV